MPSLWPLLKLFPCFMQLLENLVLWNFHVSCCFYVAGPRSAVGSTSDPKARGPGFDTRSGHILPFLLPLIQEGQLSGMAKVCAPSTGQPLRRSKPAQEKCG